MYKVEIDDTTEPIMRTLVIAPNMVIPVEGNDVVQSTNTTNRNMFVDISDLDEVNIIKSEILENERNAIQADVDAYIVAIQNQLENGGPGPVASDVVSSIVIGHDGEFEVVFKENL